MMYSHTHNRGYTLVELIVSLSIFSLVMTLAAGAYLIALNVNRNAQATSVAVDNMSFVFEKMVRPIRTGTGYSLVGGKFSFTDVDGNAVSYERAVGADGKGYIKETRSGAEVALTDPTIDIGALAFYLEGESPADAIQARVTIVVSGTIAAGPATLPFTLQTAATMRAVDL